MVNINVLYNSNYKLINIIKSIATVVTMFLLLLSISFIIIQLKNNNITLKLLNPLAVSFASATGLIYFAIGEKKNAKLTANNEQVQNKKSFMWPSIFRIFLFVLSIAFITIGIIQKELDDVLSKAVIICSECIGLG